MSKTWNIHRQMWGGGGNIIDSLPIFPHSCAAYILYAQPCVVNFWAIMQFRYVRFNWCHMELSWGWPEMWVRVRIREVVLIIVRGEGHITSSPLTIIPNGANLNWRSDVPQIQDGHSVLVCACVRAVDIVDSRHYAGSLYSHKTYARLPAPNITDSTVDISLTPKQ